MAISRFTDTILGPGGQAQSGVEVRARKLLFQPGETVSNVWLQAWTNQAGVFAMDLTQGETVRVVITDLGLDASIEVPAQATFGLDEFIVP